MADAGRGDSDGLPELAAPELTDGLAVELELADGPWAGLAPASARLAGHASSASAAPAS